MKRTIDADALRVIEQVAEENFVTVDELKSPVRTLPYTRVRALAYAALRELDYTVVCIGRFFNRDHKNVINAMQRHKVFNRRKHENA